MKRTDDLCFADRTAHVGKDAQQPWNTPRTRRLTAASGQRQHLFRRKDGGKAADLQKEKNKSIGERLSALRSASGQNLTAIGSRHSLAEAMFDLSLTLFRLVCSYHLRSPLSGFQTKSILMYYTLLCPEMSSCKFTLKRKTDPKKEPAFRFYFQQVV